MGAVVLALMVAVVSVVPAPTCLSPERLKLEPVPQLEVLVDAPEGRATLVVAVVSPDDVTVTTVRQAVRLAGEAELVRVPMPGLAFLDSDERQELRWDRLVVRLERERAAPCETLVTLAEVTDELFELELFGTNYVVVDSELSLRARARHPATGAGVPGVRLEAYVGGRRVATGLTGPSGLSELSFTVHATDVNRGWGLDGYVIAHHGQLSERVDLDGIVVDAAFQVAVVTDRPLYRPGQTVHLRALVREPGGAAASEVPVRLTLRDPQGRLIRSAAGQTSRFGIAHGSWDLPDDAEHGHWRVRADVEPSDSSWGTRRIEVSEYELPRLRVNAEPMPSVLLPGDVGVLEVEVTTLSGEPLAGADVQVEAVEIALWDRAEQSDELVWAGTTGPDGRCRAAIGDLQEAREQLGRWTRWSDRRFRIVAVDPVSGWTAATTTKVRVSNEAVHLRLRHRANVGGEGCELWASTFAADGEPVSCQVEAVIRSQGERPEVLADFSTNEHGLGVAELVLKEDAARYEVEATATCFDGDETSDREWFWWDGDPGVEVKPSKWFVPSGEPVQVQLSSVVDTGRAIVEVLATNRLVDRRTVVLDGGRADVVIPTQPDRAGLVHVQAYLDPTDNPLPFVEQSLWQGVGRVGIVVGGAPHLTANVAVRPGTASPGAEVQLDLAAWVDGQPAEAVFGLTAVDTAYEAVLAQRWVPNPDAWFVRTSEAAVESGSLTHSFAGVRVLDLLHVDPAAVPPGYDLIARYLLTDTGFVTELTGDGRFEARRRYGRLCRQRVDDSLIGQILAASTVRIEPVSTAGLERWLASRGVELDTITDPWGTPFALVLSVHRDLVRVGIWSAGFDREHDTEDDLFVKAVHWSWFEWMAIRLETAIAEAWTASGRAWTVDDVLRRADLPDSALETPDGEPLELVSSVRGGAIGVCAISPKLEKTEHHRRGRAWQCGRRGVVGVAEYDTFAPHASEIEAALVAWRRAGHPFPASVGEVREAVQAAGIDLDNLVDPRGQPYRIDVRSSVELRNDVSGRVGAGAHERITMVEPVRREVRSVCIEAADPDTLRWTPVHTISSDFVEVAAVSGSPLDDPVLTEISEDSGYGAIIGRVLYEGEALPGVTVTIEAGEVVTELVTDADGRFGVRLRPQLYSITFSLAAFRTLEYEISVDAGEIRELDVVMLAAAIAEEIIVTASVPDAEPAVVAGTGRSAPATVPFSTPRIRSDFRETLLWAPEVVTGEDGRATVDCVLADNVTDWHVQAVATTIDGQMATATSHLVASLPVTVEVDLPEHVTVGDRLELPVVVRNLTGAPTDVTVDVELRGGLELADHAKSPALVSVGSGTASRVVLPIHVVTAGDGAVMATARSDVGGDGIERTTRIVPDGQEIRRVSAGTLRQQLELALELPKNGAVGTGTARLKVYPGLGAHVVEGLVGIDARPIGCAEQITSAAWLALLILDIAKGSDEVDPSVLRAARARVVEAVQRLDRLTGRNGGVPFWRGGEPEVALTAHVCRFLLRAEPYADQARDVLGRNIGWLVDVQRGDGSFQSRFGGARRSVTLTASVLRAFAEASVADDVLAARVKPALELGMRWLADWVETVQEPLTLALWVAALRAVDRAEEAAEVEQRLVALAQSEDGTVYWHSRFNTPLYGWGLPGRIETTAEVTRALQTSDVPEHRQLGDLGVLFLLRHKDPHGVWFTTPATLAAFEAMVATAGLPTGASGGVVVSSNGERVGSLELPPGDAATPPIVLDFDGLGPGSNRVLLTRTSAGGRAVVELVGRWYEPWEQQSSSASNDDLGLSVRCDPRSVHVGEKVTCTVTARRGGHRGYGMMLARIGLPPGAEVDRTRLPGLGHLTEVHPDEVVLYLWRDTTVELVFRPRIAGTMVTRPSSLTDYYNPDTRVVVPPIRFMVQ